jgi:hypothetical protein
MRACLQFRWWALLDMGICRATVTKYNKQDKLWTVVYDADSVAEEFDHEDMLQYVIDKSAGTAPPDGGAALKRNAEARNRHEPVSMWGGDSQPRESVPHAAPAPAWLSSSSIAWAAISHQPGVRGGCARRAAPLAGGWLPASSAARGRWDFRPITAGRHREARRRTTVRGPAAALQGAARLQQASGSRVRGSSAQQTACCHRDDVASCRTSCDTGNAHCCAVMAQPPPPVHAAPGGQGGAQHRPTFGGGGGGGHRGAAGQHAGAAGSTAALAAQPFDALAARLRERAPRVAAAVRAITPTAANGPIGSPSAAAAERGSGVALCDHPNADTGRPPPPGMGSGLTPLPAANNIRGQYHAQPGSRALRADPAFHNPYGLDQQAASAGITMAASSTGTTFQQCRSFAIASYGAAGQAGAAGQEWSLDGWKGYLHLRGLQNRAHAADAVQRGVRCAKAGDYPAAMKHYAYALHIDVRELVPTSVLLCGRYLMWRGPPG